MYTVTHTLSSANRHRKTNATTMVYKKFHIDLKSAILTLITCIEGNIFQGYYMMLAHYIRALSFLTSSEKMMTNLNIYKNMLLNVAPEDTISTQVIIDSVSCS